MKRKFLGTVCFLAVYSVFAFQPYVFGAQAGAFAEHYNAGQNYLMQSQYSSSIVEFRKALRINYLDNTEASQRLERKIDNIHSMAVASANAE